MPNPLPLRFFFLRWRLLGTFALTVLAGCAHAASEPLRVSFAQIGSGGLREWTGDAPLIIEFQAGDRVPIHLEWTSDDFGLEPSAPRLDLVARQHCFVRLERGSIRTSLDGRTFDEPRQPGSFRLGLNATKGEPPRFDVIINGPRR